MIKCRIIAAVAVSLFSAGICSADSLVITYRSGKTQTVTLDEPSTTINSWQFVAGSTAATPLPTLQQPTPQPQAAAKAAPEKNEAKTAEKKPEKKSNVRFMWNAKPIAD